MLYLLNEVNIFGANVDWSSMKTAIWLIGLESLLVVIACTLIIYLIMRRIFRKKVTEKVAVTAIPAPQSTIVVEKPVVVEPVVVQKPVVVETAPVVVERRPEPIVLQQLEEESVKAGKLRYDKCFEARLIQSTDDIKYWYTEIKNLLLSYNTCKCRTSWKRETFKANKQVVARLGYRGKKLCLFLALSTAEYLAEQYATEDASETPIYADTPVMIRLSNKKRVRIAKELIETLMREKDVSPNSSYVSQDFYVPYEGVVELIHRGLIRREIKLAGEEEIFEHNDN